MGRHIRRKPTPTHIAPYTHPHLIYNPNLANPRAVQTLQCQLNVKFPFWPPQFPKSAMRSTTSEFNYHCLQHRPNNARPRFVSGNSHLGIYSEKSPRQRRQRQPQRQRQRKYRPSRKIESGLKIAFVLFPFLRWTGD